jgi:hypothetical protein
MVRLMAVTERVDYDGTIPPGRKYFWLMLLRITIQSSLQIRRLPLQLLRHYHILQV